ncbi:MAG TPA: YegS/Rv2252/BmrU family lipid kinase [Candidatus Limnocylindrales bacterium]|nr:YegS/Rv2252/BmrU family lipid kinase [Candidatus Limnocylindrales bacterium]
MSPTRRVRVVWNPNAGSKVGLPTNTAGREQLEEVMAKHGLGSDLVTTRSEEEARRAVRDAVAAGVDVVAAAGGDGTARLAATELLGSETALAILPLGSVMNLARSLDVPRDLDPAARLVMEGPIRAIDVGEVEHGSRVVPFFEGASVGLSAALFAQAQEVDRGRLGGFVGALRVLLGYRPHRMRLELDEEVVETRAVMIAVANGPYVGIGFTVAPEARLDDGCFDVRVFSHLSRWEAVAHLVSVAAGRRRYQPRVATYRSAHVTISGRHPLQCRADGIDLGRTPVSLRVRRHALRVVVPHDAGHLGAGVPAANTSFG